LTPQGYPAASTTDGGREVIPTFMKLLMPYLIKNHEVIRANWNEALVLWFQLFALPRNGDDNSSNLELLPRGKIATCLSVLEVRYFTDRCLRAAMVGSTMAATYFGMVIDQYDEPLAIPFHLCTSGRKIKKYVEQIHSCSNRGESGRYGLRITWGEGGHDLDLYRSYPCSH